MEKVGVLKDVDKLGRIVIPKELRERYGFCERVELIALKEGILICNQSYELTKREK